MISKCKSQAYCCWLPLLLLLQLSHQVYSYVYIYVLYILNYAMQSVSMDNFVNLIVYLSTVMMENGEKSVPETVSGILICQWLLVQNWATVNLVSQLFVMDKLTWFFILEVNRLRTVCLYENPLKVFILSNCKEPGLTNCTVTSSDICATTCFVVSLRTCNTGSS